jgi:hypothetical protein
MKTFVEPEPAGNSGMRRGVFNSRIMKFFLASRLSFEIIKGLNGKEGRVYAQKQDVEHTLMYPSVHQSLIVPQVNPKIHAILPFRHF